MYGIHFGEKWKLKGPKILIGPVRKNSTVCDLSLMALTRFELYFAFQIYIPCCEQPLIQIGINRPDRKFQFRMICNDLVRRLSLLNKRGYDLVLFAKLTFGKIDPGSGVRKRFAIFSIREPCIVCIFMSNGTMIDLFGASIADVWSLI